MEYAFDSKPYEHTCQECGRHQRVNEYGKEPSFALDDVRESEDGDKIKASVVVQLNEYFKCIACGDVTYFDEQIIKTGVGASVDWRENNLDTVEACRKMKREFRKQHDAEDFL